MSRVPDIVGVEQSISIPFQPKGDCHAITLRAAIGYDSGTKSVNLPVSTGVWQASNRATLGYEEGQSGWFSLSALWSAGAVKDTNP